MKPLCPLKAGATSFLVLGAATFGHDGAAQDARARLLTSFVMFRPSKNHSTWAAGLPPRISLFPCGGESFS